MEGINVIINQVLRQPAIVMGIVVLLGHLALRSKFKNTLVSVAGTISLYSHI